MHLDDDTHTPISVEMADTLLDIHALAEIPEPLAYTPRRVLAAIGDYECVTTHQLSQRLNLLEAVVYVTLRALVLRGRVERIPYMGWVRT